MIIYKAEGDGFQVDAWYQDSFTNQVYMSNDQVPENYLNRGLSLLHSRVMVLFDSVKEYLCQFAMDNMFNRAAFCKVSYNHPGNVLCHEVTRLGMRGIIPSIQQKEVKNKRRSYQFEKLQRLRYYRAIMTVPILLHQVFTMHNQYIT